MSVLQPETCRLLAKWTREAPNGRLIRERSEDDRRAFAEIREWMQTKPHTSECRCSRCKPKTVLGSVDVVDANAPEPVQGLASRLEADCGGQIGGRNEPAVDSLGQSHVGTW